MQNNSLHLKALDINVQVPVNLIINYEGHIQTYDFYNRVKIASTGKGITLLEAQELPVTLGGYECFKSTGNPSLNHVHYFVENAIKTTFPLNMYVLAHEEAEILVRKELLNQPEELVAKLNKTGIYTSDLPNTTTEYHKIGHIGGLAYLASQKTLPKNELNSMWKSFFTQSVHLIKDPAYQEALRWVNSRIVHKI